MVKSNLKFTHSEKKKKWQTLRHFIFQPRNQLRTDLLRVITQRVPVIPSQRFWTIYRSRLCIRFHGWKNHFASYWMCMVLMIVGGLKFVQLIYKYHSSVTLTVYLLKSWNKKSVTGHWRNSAECQQVLYKVHSIINLTCRKNKSIWNSLINERKWIFLWQPGELVHGSIRLDSF
jgi:hypothetical protein